MAMTESFRLTETAAGAPGTPPSPRQRHPVTTRTVDQNVWAIARRLADGDVSRIEVRTPASVVVHNHPVAAGSHHRRGTTS
jgi:hypothetical protein